MLRLFFALILFIGTLSAATAQKYGHLNFANLLSEMPGTKAAESELEAFNKQLVARGERMVTELKARVSAAEAKAPDMAPVDLNKLRTELNGERDKIARFERQMSVDLEEKRQELLAPLINQVRQATKEAAKEGGYQLVFDTSIFNTVLYAADSEDLAPAVKAKLGM